MDERLGDGLTKVMDAETTRRIIVKTGVKLAYAAPLVAASFRLATTGASAQVSGRCPGCRREGPVCNACFGDDCSTPGVCCCFQTTEGDTSCADNFGVCLGAQCTSSSECGPGEACFVTCCSPSETVGLCAPCGCDNTRAPLKVQRNGPTGALPN